MDFAAVQTANLGVFGVTLTVTPSGGQPVAARGIFRAAHQQVDPETGAMVLIDQPVLDVRLAEMPNGDIKRGDLVTINAKVYEVIEVRKDGEGMAACRMFWK